MLAATVGEQADDLAHADERTREAFPKKGAPHDGELRDFDVILERAAVETRRQEEHVAQQRVAEPLVEKRAGRTAVGLERGLVEPGDPGVERAEAVDGLRELAGDVGEQGFVIIVQPKVLPGHRHARAQLRTQVQLLATDAQLTHQLHQRRALSAFRHPVGQRVQADVILPLAAGVEGVEAAGGVVPLQDQHLPTEHPQPHGSGEPGHARPDDDGVVMGGGSGHRANLGEARGRSSDALRAS